jgi:hypothetical protein
VTTAPTSPAARVRRLFLPLVRVAEIVSTSVTTGVVLSKRRTTRASRVPHTCWKSAMTWNDVADRS